MIERVREKATNRARNVRNYVRRLDQHEKRLDEQKKRIDEWARAVPRARVEYSSAAHQIAALEKRVAELEAATRNPVDPGDAAARSEARDIVQTVRTEHERVRTRLTLMSTFEERLRRLEVAVLHGISTGRFPAAPEEIVGADVIEARAAGLIAPDATELPRRN